ncbi:MAG: ABC transporter ATP-binding protein [Roseiflexaceae bacterium]|nr:ABC transporter ATP-binding protein [Roseiflexaceae bacterium]
MIQIRDIEMGFGGVRALSKLTVDLDDTIVGVIGPNGAGKTTLLNVLNGFLRPQAGSITAFGQDLLALAPHRRAHWGLRRTFQNEQVVDDMSLWDNVAVMLDTVRLARTARNDQVQAAIHFVGLSGNEQRLGRSLNAFERRMAEIARAVVGTPRLILMDEPGAGLSPQESGILRAVITSIPVQFGAMVVLIDHDVQLIAATCAKTAVLDFGTLIAYGPTDHVLKDSRVKAAYLGEEVV